MSIIDGRFLAERPEAALAAGRHAKVSLIVGANDRELPLGEAADKGALWAAFGEQAEAAIRPYDPRGDQALADLAAAGGAPVWLYRFGYVPEAQRGQHMGALRGMEIPFGLNMPQRNRFCSKRL